MKMNQRAVSLLLRSYPRAWRREYGPEVADLLLAGGLSPRVIADVLWSGLRERVRSSDAATRLGVLAMAAIGAVLAWNIVAPQPSGGGWTALLVPSSKTLPTVFVAPFVNDAYLLALAVLGCWLALQRGFRSAQAGVAAMRVSFIGGLPIVIAGVLMLSGVLGLIVLTPGVAPTTYREHGLAFTFYAAGGGAPSPLSITLAPLFRLPEAWLWGTIGGAIGRWFSRMPIRIDASV